MDREKFEPVAQNSVCPKLGLPKTRSAQNSVVTFFGLFNSGELFVQFFGCEKCGGVDPLKLLTGWILFPVGIRNGE